MKLKGWLGFGLIIILIAGMVSVFKSPGANEVTNKIINNSLQTKSSNVGPKEVNATNSSTKKVVGYYGGWGAYSGYEAKDIKASKLTHLNYAFADVSDGGKVVIGDPEVDPTNFQQLKQLKLDNPNLQTLISVGGWSYSENFSDAAATPSAREKFAESAVSFIQKHGFDGVDIDWEYPVNGGAPNNKHRPEDKENFTLLIKETRSQLDALEQKTGEQYILTIAGTAGTSFLKNTEMDKLATHLDFVNLMTYDINGQWYQKTGHNAPLYTSSGNPPNKWSADDTVKVYAEAGVPKDKLVLGVPFYGRKYDAITPLNKGLHQPFVVDGGSLTYDTLEKSYINQNGYKRHLDPETKVPYLWNGTSSFISYEDPESIGFKTDYIHDNGLAGAMIWELSHDRKGKLLEALYTGLMAK
ncbi:glycoside hydrolase family 18 protein [Pseudalkalibacillus sp. Hm43]|uniref:glycoside hydrolase family 18 protein n=1 Tax=Pseudalkalibacillus sp. Hm43 TaxID=3450742 RepID=UPI003F4375F7